MSFVQNGLTLPNSAKHVSQSRLCSKCGEMRLPEGGIQMSPEKWYCAACWIKRTIRRKTK